MIDYAKVHGFFDDYPAYYETSRTRPLKTRLSTRYRALIEAHRELLKGKRILDIASHDGRWSFAALNCGAAHVTGIEARCEMVADSSKNMELYGIDETKYTFICGDAIAELSKIESNSVDVVFCFGFLYHTIHHMYLLSQIKRCRPEYLILDTGIAPSNESIIEMHEDSSALLGSATALPGENALVIVGWPSRSALEMMLRNLGFEFSYVDWHAFDIADWSGIEDYRDGRRVTLLARTHRPPTLELT